MTPEREAQMREALMKWFNEWHDPNVGIVETRVKWQTAQAAWLACARALEPMVRDAELYHWLRSQYLAVDFDYDGECVLVFKIPKNTRVRADCDVTIKAAMSAALEEEKNANQ